MLACQCSDSSSFCATFSAHICDYYVAQFQLCFIPQRASESAMRIAKPLLLVTTPIGVAGAIHEAFRLAGGLGFLMVMFMVMMSLAIGGLVLTIRKEQRATLAKVEGVRS